MQKLVKELFTPKEDPNLASRMREFLSETQERTEPYETEILGNKFIVFLGVFSPEYYTETEFFTKEVQLLVERGDRFLEVGCGIGATSIIMALKGAEVTSLDINPKAVMNTKENVGRYNLENRVKVMQSNVYDALDKDEKFDVIYGNIPWVHLEESEKDLPMIERALFDPEHRALKEFFSGASKQLRKNGTFLFGNSSTLGDVGAIQVYSEDAGLNFEQIAETRDPNDIKHDVRFELLRARVN